MRNKLILILLCIFMQFGLNAQEAKSNNGLGFGYHLNQLQNDFGMGINLTSPFFVHEHIGIRLKANLMYNQSVLEGKTEWVPYSNMSLGMIGLGGNLNDRIRLYSEGGVLFILSSDKISSEKLEIGGYGLFGFEFFFSDFGNYFIEIGGVGTGAKADKQENSPIYSNGMTISVGLRYFLK